MLVLLVFPEDFFDLKYCSSVASRGDKVKNCRSGNKVLPSVLA